MKRYNYPDAKQVLVSGDIHGDFKLLVHNLCIRYGCTDTLLIVAGDCGFGFDKPGYYEIVYNSVADRLRKANNWVVFVRGNHDDPSYFAGEIINHTVREEGDGGFIADGAGFGVGDEHHQGTAALDAAENGFGGEILFVYVDNHNLPVMPGVTGHLFLIYVL